MEREGRSTAMSLFWAPGFNAWKAEGVLTGNAREWPQGGCRQLAELSLGTDSSRRQWPFQAFYSCGGFGDPCFPRTLLSLIRPATPRCGSLCALLSCGHKGGSSPPPPASPAPPAWASPGKAKHFLSINFLASWHCHPQWTQKVQGKAKNSSAKAPVLAQTQLWRNRVGVNGAIVPVPLPAGTPPFLLTGSPS